MASTTRAKRRCRGRLHDNTYRRPPRSRVVINSALTRWLKQGLTRGECPLCRVAHKAENEFLWYFFDEYSTQDDYLDRLRSAGGFCARHADGLRRIEVVNLNSTLGISETYEDLLTGLLDSLRDGARLPEAPCPACAYRDEQVTGNAAHLATLLADDERSRERFAASPGLCFPHLALLRDSAPPASVLELAFDVQRRAVALLHDQLAEHIRKQGDEARGEVPGPEVDAWQRAIWLTAGWPGDLDAQERPE